MNYSFVAIACAMLVGCALALQIPDVKDQPDKPVDPKQIKNATITFYNNGTYIYLLELPCEAYLTPGGGRAGQQQQRSGQQHSAAQDEEDDESNDDEEQTPQQRQRQQQQQRQRQQQQRSGSSAGRAGSQHHEYNPEELRQAHEGTECECKCKNHDGEELDDIITVTMGGKGHGMSPSSQQRGGQNRSQQQRAQQQQQQRQRQQQQQRGGAGGSSSSSHHDEEEGPELVYPAQPRAGQKCIFFEEGEWENDDDELIDAVGPDNKTPGEPEDEVLEKCTFNFKQGGAGQQSSGAQSKMQVKLQCVDNHGEQDQYTVMVVNGELKPKLTPQQKQEAQQQKKGKTAQTKSRNQ